MVDEIGACCYIKEKKKNKQEIFERGCTQKCAGEHVK